MKIKLPFSGFYNSIHNSMLDNELASLFQDDSARDLAFDSIAWLDCHKNYAKKYTEEFKNRFDLYSIKFTSLWSPKYYNYETDEIIADISFQDVKKMRRNVSTEALQKRIKERFTSYDGFISHYPNQLSEWPKSLSDWDMNHLMTLCEVYISQHDESDDFEYRIAEDIEGCTIIDSCIDDARKYKIANYLEERAQRD